MNLKKLILNFLTITIGLILFILWHQNNINSTKANSLLRYKKIYLVTMDKEFEFWNYVNQGASDLARAIGVPYFWVAPETRDFNEQIKIIDDIVDDGANAILVAVDDPRKLASVIEDAKARGVKIVYVDAPSYEEAITTLMTDNYEAGRAVAGELLRALEEQNIGSGEIGIVSLQSRINDNTREKGIKDVIEEDGRFILNDTVYTNAEVEETRVVVDGMIQGNANLVGLIGTNEGVTEGLGKAIRDNNNKVIGVGFDKTNTILQLLEEGSLKAVIVQNPYTMGYLGVAEAVAGLEGMNTGPSIIDTGFTVLRKE